MTTPGQEQPNPSTEPATKPFWLATLLADPECEPLLEVIAAAPAETLFAADPVCLPVLIAALEGVGKSTHAVFPLAQASVRLAKNFDLRRFIVVSALAEEAARDELREKIKREQFPDAILENLEVATFVADFLATTATKKPLEAIRSRRPDFSSDPRPFVIVNIPRAGSTYLGGLLQSSGLGDPFEHVRPWLVRLLQQRPAGLFDSVRFARNVMKLGAVGGVFGTKIISHFLREIVPVLDPTEREYFTALAASAGVVYLYRRDKLDQAISELRAAVSGAWHASDAGSKTSLPAGALGGDFDALAFRVEALLAEERRLAALLAEAPNLSLLDYDILSSRPDEACRQIGALLGLPLKGPAESRYVKLADDSSRALKADFLAAHPDYATDSLLSGEDALRDARAELMQRREQLASRAARIRSGHAATANGDYQDRHYYLVDYNHQWQPGLDFMFRGPVPAGLADGDYIAYLGASQTLGAFVARPFAAQVAERTGVEPLNLGRGGAGPSHFLRLPVVRDWIANARAVVVQAMSARMSETEMFRPNEGRAGGVLIDPSGAERPGECEEAWSSLFAEGSPEKIERVVGQARRHWVSSLHEIAKLARGPTLLLWMSGRAPAYDADPNSREQMLNQFPELIDRDTLMAAATAFADLVEVVAHQSKPEPTVSAFSGELLPVVFGGGNPDTQTVEIHNLYYPGQAAHDAVAQAITPVLQHRLGAGRKPTATRIRRRGPALS